MKLIANFVAVATLIFSVPAVGAEELNTDHLFSFNAGSDIGEPGEKEVQGGFSGRFGKAGGTYSALAPELAFQTTPVRNVEIGVAASASHFTIKNVPDLDDRNITAFSELSFGVAYRLVDRAATGLGLRISAEPHWERLDDITGEPINGYGTDFALAADRELVPERILGVLNVLYQPEVDQSRLDGTWSRETVAGLGAGLMFKAQENIFVGVESRYLRKYESLDFSAFSGQAFFLGPSVSLALSKQSWLTAGWNAQVAGRAVADGGSLDLVNFNRHEFRLAIGTEF